MKEEQTPVCSSWNLPPVPEQTPLTIESWGIPLCQRGLAWMFGGIGDPGLAAELGFWLVKIV